MEPLHLLEGRLLSGVETEGLAAFAPPGLPPDAVPAGAEFQHEYGLLELSHSPEHLSDQSSRGIAIPGGQLVTRGVVHRHIEVPKLTEDHLPHHQVTGEKVWLVAEALDADTGVQYVVVTLSSPSDTHSASAGLYLNPGTERFEGPVTIPVYSENGTWRVTRVYALDKAGNSVTITESDPLLQ